jgi:Aminotransferase class-V
LQTSIRPASTRGDYTWRRQARRAGSSILTVRRRPDDSWTEAVLAALDERASIVSVPNVHWTDGAPVDLAAIADGARDVGASLVVDASQSLGALPLDVGRVRPDFVIAVGYKWLLEPFGLGYLYVADEHRGGEPLEENWVLRAGSEDFAALVDYRDEYQPGARRFDVGQRTSFELTPMAIAALEQLLAWGIPRISATLAGTTHAISTQLSAIGFDVPPASQRAPHLLGVALPPTLRAVLVPHLERANCLVALRGRSMGIAPHLHITPADIDPPGRRPEGGHPGAGLARWSGAWEPAAIAQPGLEDVLAPEELSGGHPSHRPVRPAGSPRRTARGWRSRCHRRRRRGCRATEPAPTASAR